MSQSSMPVAKRTEEEILRLLTARYTRDSGNGPEFAFIPKVRNAASFDATRTADAIAMTLWKSRGLELHGFEIKCDRRDWQRELAKPEKMERFSPLVDRWWVVAGESDIVRDGELPAAWGLIVVGRKGALTTKVQAPKLHHAHEPMTFEFRSFLAALLRSAARVQGATPEEIEAAVKIERERQQRYREEQSARDDETIRLLRARLDAFKAESGIALGDPESEPQLWHGGHPADRVGAAVRLYLQGEFDVERLERRIEQIRQSALSLAEDATKTLGRAA